MDRRDFLRAGGAMALGAAGTVSAAGTAAAAATAAGGGRAGAASAAPQFFGRGAPGRRSDAWVGLDVRSIADNMGIVRARAGGCPIMAVVKANAYGHGLVESARAMAAQGADAFMVANTQEAMALKEAEIEQPVVNFGTVFGGAAEQVVSAGIEQVVDSTDLVSSLVAAAAMQQAHAVVHVHIDTGLGRMGVPWRQAGELLEYVGSRRRVRIAGVSTAFTEDEEFDRVQLQRFVEICDAATAARIDIGRRHAASSAALLAMPDAHLDMVRPGIALYGHYPSDAARQREPELGLAPVLGLRARVAAVRSLRQGESVGYHRAHLASEPETIAVLPIGYADGYPPEAVAAGGHVTIRGRRCPFVGAMSANHCMVRVPDDLEVNPGDLALMIATGRESAAFGGAPADPIEGPPTAQMVADWAGVSIYRLHIAISPELPRTLEGRQRRF